MSKKILILNGHPEKGSFCESLAKRYYNDSCSNGNEAKLINIIDLDFDKNLLKKHHNKENIEPEIFSQQELILWCDHLVIIAPNWFWNVPAIMRSYFERVFTRNFSTGLKDTFPYYKSLLTGREATIIYTQNAPAWIEKFIIQNLFRKNLMAILKPAGFKPIKFIRLTSVIKSTIEQRKKWLASLQ